LIALRDQRSVVTLVVSNSAREPSVPEARASDLVLADRQLVDACLSGETGAWSVLYRRFHDSLITSIRSFLGRSACDGSLVDEIAARVWYALVRNDFELLARFDVTRGCRLSTFLSVLAKTEARLLLRSERRRRIREQAVSRSEAPAKAGGPATENLSEEEFMTTLSPAERTFYEDVLKTSESEIQLLPDKYTPQNKWQLRHRVRKKLEQFLS
jgi:DNA-directed RNA polymerase specialized sigma24 family protein